MQKLILLFIGLLFLTCSVQKRRYQKGYHIGRIHQKAEAKTKIGHPALLGKNTNYPAIGIASKDHEVIEQNPSSTAANNSVQSTKEITLPNDSCDVLLFKDGSEVQGKVIEINPTHIKYKRCDLLDGPLYTVKKSDVFMVKYSNGVREVIKEEAPPPQSVNPVQVPPNYQIPNKNMNGPVNTRNQKVHPSAIWAFVWGLISLLSFLLAGGAGALLLAILSLTSAIRAISASIKAIRQVNNYPTEFKGKGLAMTGRVIGIVVLSLFLIVIIAIISLI